MVWDGATIKLLKLEGLSRRTVRECGRELSFCNKDYPKGFSDCEYLRQRIESLNLAGGSYILFSCPVHRHLRCNPQGRTGQGTWSCRSFSDQLKDACLNPNVVTMIAEVAVNKEDLGFENPIKPDKSFPVKSQIAKCKSQKNLTSWVHFRLSGPKVVVKVNQLCYRLYLDTTTLRNPIGFIMECSE